MRALIHIANALLKKRLGRDRAASRLLGMASELLGDLERNDDGVAIELDVHLQLGVDLWELPGRELHVHDRAGNADHSAGLQYRFGDGQTVVPSVFSRIDWIKSFASSPPRSSAPPTMSMISVVIAA